MFIGLSCSPGHVPVGVPYVFRLSSVTHRSLYRRIKERAGTGVGRGRKGKGRIPLKKREKERKEKKGGENRPSKIEGDRSKIEGGARGNGLRQLILPELCI